MTQVLNCMSCMRGYGIYKEVGCCYGSNYILYYFHDITRPVLPVAVDVSVFLERLRVLPPSLASAIACSSSYLCVSLTL